MLRVLSMSKRTNKRCSRSGEKLLWCGTSCIVVWWEHTKEQADVFEETVTVRIRNRGRVVVSA
jgi:hypothetical protein